MTPTQLRTARRKLGLSRRELARLLDVSKRTIERWEAGGTIPQVAAMAIAYAFTCDAVSDEQGALEMEFRDPSQ